MKDYRLLCKPERSQYDENEIKLWLNYNMKVIDFSQTNSILNQYISEIRNVEVQNDRLRFRRNIERIGEIMAYEMSKEFRYSVKNIRFIWWNG